MAILCTVNLKAGLESAVDLAQVAVPEGAQPAPPGDVIEAQQTSAIRVDQAINTAPVAPAVAPIYAATGSTPSTTIAASGSPPKTDVAAHLSEVEIQLQPQPKLLPEPQPSNEPRPHNQTQLTAPMEMSLPLPRPQVPTDLVQAAEASPRNSSAMLEMRGLSATAAQLKHAADKVALQGHRLTEAGGSVARTPSTGDTAAAEEPIAIKVKTTRRPHQAGAGCGTVGDTSSSVSHSHSTASSQQPGSYTQQATNLPQDVSSVMMGSSAAQAPSTAGETAAPTGAGASRAGSEAIEGSNNAMSEPSATGSTPASKGGNTGFMFGAPRLKEHKKERRKDVKRSKSQSSGSNASGAQPAPGGSEVISGSKASGSDALAGGGTGSGIRATGSSGQAGTMVGSSAADPSLGSLDMMASSTPTIGTAGAGSPTLGAQPGGGLYTAGSSTGGTMDYSSVGRRISRPTRGSKPDAPAATAVRPNSRARTDPSGSNAASSSNNTGGGASAEASAPGAESMVGPCNSGMPEAVPEGEEDGEDEEGARSDGDGSPRSSSEHLSIMSPPEGSDVENVLMLICNIFQLPVALVAAYRYGLPGGGGGAGFPKSPASSSANIFIRSTALRLTDDDQWRYSLAQWSMLNAYELRDVLIVPDAGLDDRFREYYCVKQEPKVKFFMASPLRSSTGEVLGTLCMADFKERTLEPTNLLVVNNLQTLVIRQLERDMALAQERAQNEEATEQLQQEMMRALDHFEKCIMFVDTSKPGWEVLYTNMAWEHVTGVPREHVLGRVPDGTWDPSRVPRVHVMGRPLHDFFMALGGAALDWSSTADEVASRAEFTVHRVAVRQKPDKLVSLHLRLATQQASGELEGLLPKGLPGWVKARGNEAHNYFVFVEEVNPQAGGGSTVYEALAKHVEKVPGLELSHLLGKGGFGSVYYGTWNGMPVAVKMIDNKLTKTNTEGVSLEALMGQELSHPNIVKTIKYVMRSNINASSVSGSNSRGGVNSARNMPPGLHSRNREGHGPYSGGIAASCHGSRNVMLPAAGSSGAGVNGNGGANGGAAPHQMTGMMSYMTSAQPGLSGMTSAQMAAAADLTSASAMQHFSRMGTTMTSDATTVAGGGSQYSGKPRYGSGVVDGSSGVPLREFNLAAAGVPKVPGGSAAPGTAATSATTTSGATAVGPASLHASSASTAAGPPSIASAGGIAANQTGIASPAASSRTVSVTGPTPEHASVLLASGGHAGHEAALASRLRGSGPLSLANAPDKKPVAMDVSLPAQMPPLAAPAGDGAPSITAPYPPGAPPPNLQHLTLEQQQAAMTSRFSLAFSTITSGGDVLVPGKGSRSPSTSSGGHTQQMGHTGSVGSGEDMGEVWIIMEFCDRGSLQDALDRGALKLRKPGGEMGETHLPMMVATACEVASALQYLHERGIVHGDLTAWNVMLCTSEGGQQDRSGRTFVAKVADFGLSRTLDVRSKIKTRTYGTISHMPPECLISGIISKASAGGEATDVFAFGVLLWQMYTGLRPWAGMNHGQIIYNVGMKNVQLLFPPGTPPAIADLSSSCTRTEPTQRPSFKEILEKLDNIRASLGL
ncbi:hypothetical protein VOLCADRAFT_96512 [Volvox carteri f. nagariensis]|uniref:Protein kinase domain-containing protein n=1 Tax=Volvox carteri f. nagariensis TaxID=3068 RepID=D8UAB1_VOLCA|nr:uncharacterized protein VOLCADRAFT_96512 [Volvox carteri f. nagariensis]EFJ43286.1 hypothetical protein VOLCADRAFT_96512 [Volvox carteri f. nagariensis]|eukprot:XP_002955646.1 hypothetical protein VOLCADRAFT_96512 [Volvox carteri f. nagariensis]